MRTLRAFVWLRWRLLRNSLRSGQRRDALEQFSRGIAFLMPAIVVVLSLGSILGSGVAGFFAGYNGGRGDESRDLTVLGMRILLLGAFVFQVIFATVSPTQSAFAKYTRLLLLPIRRRTLHLIEVISTLADPWMFIVVPGLAMFAIGLLIGGRADVAAVALVAGALLLGVLAAFGSLIAFLIGWLLRNRRRAEMFTLIFVISLSLLSVIPATMSKRFNRNRQPRDATATTERPQSLEQFNASLPQVTVLLPSELYGRTIASAFDRRHAQASLYLVGLLLELGLVYLASAAAHRRMIDAVDSSKGWRRRATGARLGPRVPGLTTAASAVALTQLRTAIRTVRGRTIILLPGPMFAILTFFFRNSEERWAGYLTTNGYLLFAVSGLFALYALQAFTMNLFATDRAGLTLQFLSPVSDRELAVGKLVGCAAILTATLALALAASLLVSPAGSIFLWVTVILGTYASFLLLSPAAVWLSALFPLASDLTKTGSGGNPHPLPMIAGLVLTVLVSLPTAGVIVGLGLWKARPGLALALEAGWFLFALALAIPLVSLAAKTVGARRENLGLVAQGK